MHDDETLPNLPPAAEPSLLARLARDEAGDEARDGGWNDESRPDTTAAAPEQETGAGPLVEGPAAAARSGRVDAAGATYGDDLGRVGQAADGESPPTSVGGALEPPPGEGVPGSGSAERSRERAED